MDHPEISMGNRRFEGSRRLSGLALMGWIACAPVVAQELLLIPGHERMGAVQSLRRR